MRPRLLHLTLFAALAAIILAGASCGRRTPRPAPASAAPRLAVLSPALAIIVRDLGRLDTVAARHGWDMVCDPDLPVVGDQRGIDYEVLLAVNPDTILMESGAEATPARLRDLARDRGWTITRVPMLTLDDIRAAILTLDAITAPADPSPTPAARALLDRLERATAPQSDLDAHAGRTIILVSADPPGVIGPGSFHFQIARAMGVDAIPRDGAPYIAMPAEELHTLDPDTIVLLAPGAADADAITAMLAPLRALDLSAVRAGRVVVITDPLVLTPSTAMIGFAESLAERLRALPPAPH